MSTIFVTQSVSSIMNLTEKFGFMNADNMTNTSCESIGNAIDDMLSSSKKSTEYSLTRVLPTTLVNSLTPASKQESIPEPTLNAPKMRSAWKRWSEDNEFISEDIPPYWMVSDVGNAYSRKASQFSHFNPQISSSKIFMYACAPERGVAVMGPKCPFLLPLLTAFNRVDCKRVSMGSERAVKFNLPYDAVSERFRNGKRFSDISAIANTDFAATDFKTVFVFSFSKCCKKTCGILDLIVQTPYGFQSTNVYNTLAENIIGYSEVTFSSDSKKMFIDFMGLTENDEGIGVRVIEDIYSTFSPNIYPFVSAILGYGRGHTNDRESLFARIFIKALKFGTPTLINISDAFVGSELYTMRNESCRAINESNSTTINNLSSYMALRSLARYIDGDTCQMRDYPIQFGDDKRTEFKTILSTLPSTDVGKTNFSLDKTSAENYTLTTEKRYSVEYVKNYNTDCSEKTRKITAFERDSLPCPKRFTAILTRVEDDKGGIPCNIFGDLVETAGLYHEMIAYMTPSYFFFARICKFFQYYMIFLYNLIRCSLRFAAKSHHPTIIGHYRALVVGVISAVKDSTRETINRITIGDVLHKSHSIVSEESVSLLQNQIEAFSRMVSATVSTSDLDTSRVLSVTYGEW